MKNLEFNGKNILFKRIDGVYWIGIKSVCEALNINYNRQFQNIKEDNILGPAFAIQQTQVPGDQARKIACLPEKYIYGWIFSINSSSSELLEYKKDCYEVLYNHFHGTITKRAELYSEIAKEKKRISELKTALTSIPQYTELQEAEMRYTRLWKNIRETTTGESELFNDENFD